MYHNVGKRFLKHETEAASPVQFPNHMVVICTVALGSCVDFGSKEQEPFMPLTAEGRDEVSSQAIFPKYVIPEFGKRKPFGLSLQLCVNMDCKLLPDKQSSDQTNFYTKSSAFMRS